MKTKLSAAVVAGMYLMNTTAFAGDTVLKTVKDSSRKGKLASMMSDVWSVENVSSGDTTFKIISFDSRYNHDLDSTVVVSVGEGGVGGAAGHEAQFYIGPDIIKGYKSIKAVDGGVEVVGSMLPVSEQDKKITLIYKKGSREDNRDATLIVKSDGQESASLHNTSGSQRKVASSESDDLSPAVQKAVRKLKTNDVKTVVSKVVNNEENPCLSQGVSYDVALKVRKASWNGSKVVYSWETVKSVNVDTDGRVMEVCAE